jgi:hypothetical protein
MYVSTEINLGFIAHPKTASSATQRTLRKLGAELWGTHHDVDDELCCRILKTGGRIVATIRNPFDLMVSWYFHYAHRRPGKVMEPFKEWLPNMIAKPNQYLIQGMFYGLQWTNRILRFEHLQEDFDLLCDEVGLPRTIIESFNVSTERAGRPYQEMYDPDLRELIQVVFTTELDVGGYSFEE